MSQSESKSKFFKWTEEEEALLLKVIHEYKTTKLMSGQDCRPVGTKLILGGLQIKQTALGSGRIFVRPRPLDCWKATWLYKLPFSMDELLFTELRKFFKWKL